MDNKEKKEREERVIKDKKYGEVIKLKVEKGSSYNGKRDVTITFSTSSNLDKYIFKYDNERYYIRKVVDGLYQKYDETDENESNVGVFQVETDDEIEAIIQKIIEERKKYLAYQWSGEMEYIIYL
ncbi:MAG: hypothetical protein ACUVQP_08825 [Bacteroidales bacterium]